MDSESQNKFYAVTRSPGGAKWGRMRPLDGNSTEIMSHLYSTKAGQNWLELIMICLNVQIII